MNLNERIFMIEHFFREGRYSEKVKQQFRKQFPYRHAVPNREAVHNLIACFKATGSVQSKEASISVNQCPKHCTDTDDSTDEIDEQEESKVNCQNKAHCKMAKQQVTDSLKRKASGGTMHDSDSECSETGSSERQLKSKKLKHSDMSAEEQALFSELSDNATECSSDLDIDESLSNKSATDISLMASPDDAKVTQTVQHEQPNVLNSCDQSKVLFTLVKSNPATVSNSFSPKGQEPPFDEPKSGSVNQTI